MPKVDPAERYPKIDDYAFISDCHANALVSRSGSVDWSCMPRIDSPSVFGRLLDWDDGGYCSVRPAGSGWTCSRRYVEDSLVLETTFETAGGTARLLDCFAMRQGGATTPRRELLRVIEGLEGEAELEVRVVPRFDYGEVRPWVRRHEGGALSAIGGNDGLVLTGDLPLDLDGRHEVACTVKVRAGERRRLSIRYLNPASIEHSPPAQQQADELDGRLSETIGWWQAWASKCRLPRTDDAFGARRSALVLKGLVNAPTGAIAAAATTSLPESPGGERNWDYRFSWIRDSTFTVRSLGVLGYEAEADGFRRFAERSAAGSAEDLQIMYGVGGERRLTELELAHLDGYRGARPVRIGNGASRQVQLDVYGELLSLAWRWHERGHSPDPDYWRFLGELVEAACDRCDSTDRGIWEVRGHPEHFVHSKVMMWAAIDRGVRFVEDLGLQAPSDRWKPTRDRLRHTIEQRGYDARRGIFTRAFDDDAVDAALLLVPSVGFVEYDDPRMVRTVDAVRDELTQDGLLLRYRDPDGLGGDEGAFLACTFWLAECLARQGRQEEARAYFERAAGTANDLGLYAEEWDVQRHEMLGNFPQGLTHLSQLTAGMALHGHNEDLV